MAYYSEAEQASREASPSEVSARETYISSFSILLHSHISTISSLLTSSSFTVHVSQPYNRVVQTNAIAISFVKAVLNCFVNNYFLLLNAKAGSIGIGSIGIRTDTMVSVSVPIPVTVVILQVISLFIIITVQDAIVITLRSVNIVKDENRVCRG